MGITPIFDPTRKEVPTMKLDISDKRTFLTTYVCLPACLLFLSCFPFPPFLPASLPAAAFPALFVFCFRVCFAVWT